MKLISLLILFFISTSAYAEKKKTIARPTIKEGEFAVFIEDKYKIYKFKTFNDLDLSENCFKNEKPSCDAYKYSLQEFEIQKPKHESMNNPAALYCKSMGGSNLIGLNFKNNESNFCMFKDGSLVNSWSAHDKHFPTKTIK